MRLQAARRLDHLLDVAFPQFGANLSEPFVGWRGIGAEGGFGNRREILAGVIPVHDLNCGKYFSTKFQIQTAPSETKTISS